MRITHVAPLSVGKIAFVLYGCLGLFACLFLVPMMMFGAMAQSTHGFPTGIFAIGMVVAIPVLYATFGALFAMAVAALYNFVAGMVGGVELRIEPAPTAR